MSRTHTYIDAGGAWSEDITAAIRIGQTSGGPGGLKGLTQVAELGGYSTSGLEIDDVASTVGHDADGIIGLQQWAVDEDEAPEGSRRIFTGWVADRRYRNSKVLPQIGSNVSIDVDLVDLNALFSFRKFAPTDSDADRPAETCQERLDAVLASDIASGVIVDNGLVEIPDKGMDAHKYFGASLGDVIGDIAIQAGGLNWFARYNETDDLVELCMYDPNLSTIDSSTMKISNAGDDNGSTIFATSGDEELTRSPKRTYSRIDVPWAKATERVVRAATEETFARRDGTAPNATVKTAAKAREIGEDIAWRSRDEEDVIRVTVPMRAAYVTSALEGQRIQVKFRQFRGYTDWRWVRILRMTKTPWDGSEAGYDVYFELVPQGDAPPAGAIVQSAFIRSNDSPGYISLPNPVTIGNTLVWAAGKRNTPSITAPNTTITGYRFGAGAWTTLESTDDGDNGVAVFYKTADDTSNRCSIGDLAHEEIIGVWELSGVDMASATTEVVTATASAEPYATASLGTVAAGSLALAIFVVDSQPDDWPWGGPAPCPGIQNGNPGGAVPAGMTLRISKWVYDHYSLCYYIPAEPLVAIMDGPGTGAAITPSYEPGVAHGTTHSFAAIGVLVPPA